MSLQHPLVIGLVGLPGAGKTTAAEHLEKRGFTRITLSNFIKEEAKKVGIANPSREVLQDYGNKMREKFGPQVLAQLAIKKIRSEGKKIVVIDGIRNLYEDAFLRVENNFICIALVASPKVRFGRLKARSEDFHVGTYQDFLHAENREDTLGSKEIGLRVKDCIKKADYKVDNTKSIHDLDEAIDAIITLRKISR